MMKMRGVKYLVAMTLLAMVMIESSQAQLQMGYYYKSCPNAEKIVKDFVDEHIPNAPSLAAALIRMHFHDCFVRVCTIYSVIHLIFYFIFYALKLIIHSFIFYL